MALPPPQRYPHLYPLLYSTSSAGFIGLTMLYTNYLQWTLPPPPPQAPHVD